MKNMFVQIPVISYGRYTIVAIFVVSTFLQIDKADSCNWRETNLHELVGFSSDSEIIFSVLIQ